MSRKNSAGPSIQVGTSLSAEDQTKIFAMYDMMEISIYGSGWTEIIRQIIKWGYAYCQSVVEQEKALEDKQEQEKENKEAGITRPAVGSL